VAITGVYNFTNLDPFGTGGWNRTNLAFRHTVMSCGAPHLPSQVFIITSYG